jgi:2-oxoglutarate ferredoxin oxidoreductase subunit alpha
MVQKIINDFSIIVGTANGSGSQTSNSTILRALFKMGIPVSGKNLFPSNIQGLPTWYIIRASKGGFIARRDEREIVVAMNPKSFEKDLASVTPGGVFYYDKSIGAEIKRDDIFVYPMAVKDIVKSAVDIPTNLRDLVSNMVYVGILSQMHNIDMEKIEAALSFAFKGKRKPIDLNLNVAKLAAEWAKTNLTKVDPYVFENMDKTEGMIMADGNLAGALGSIYGGVQFVGWYPITPATSLAEELNEYLPKLRKTADGKETYAVVQAEDELAAIGMCIGAGWSGLRSMTSTSGPGLSLMTEFVGLAYYAEIPVVIWDVTRIGPSTGLPTRTSQGDLNFAVNMGHGDTDNIVLLPGSVNECFEFGWRSFDIAERIQTPVIILSDLDFGMNQWMTAPFKFPDVPMDRGKILWEDDLEKMKEEWGRYLDVDGDGIPYRTVPGNKHPKAPYFTRGTGHDAYAKYSEESAVWEDNLNRIKAKFATAKNYLPEPILEIDNKAKEGIITFGSTTFAVEEAISILDKDMGKKVDLLRIRAIPFSDKVEDYINTHDKVYIVEMNRDGQLYEELLINMPHLSSKLISVAFSDGMPPTAKRIIAEIQLMEKK